MEELISQPTTPLANENNYNNSSIKCNMPTVGLDDRILDISGQHSLHVLRVPSTKKAKRIRFFRNGDKFYTGIVMAVTPERYRSFDSLASELTRALVSCVTLPSGVRTIYTMDGKKVESINDLEDGKCYVVSGQGEIFKKVEYSSTKVRRGNSLSGLPQYSIGAGSQVSAIPSCVKAKIVTLIRHGTKPRRVLRLLLNKRNAPSLEHAMEAITEAVKLDSGAVRKVYTLSGQQVTNLEQFFEQDDIFLCYGSEKITQEDFELDFEESKCVQSFRRGPWTSKRQSGPMPKMPQKSGKKILSIPQVKTPSPSTLMLPQPLSLHYTVEHVIGDGHFAVVRHCIEKSTGMEYAMKIVDKYKCKGKETMLASEVAIMRQVSHPNIVSLIAEQETSDQLFLVMELVKGGDLFDAIVAATKFSEPDARIMIRHLTSALAYLHFRQIVHRDVKPENLLVQMDENQVRCLKLGDFGLAQVVKEPLYTVCGTPTYVAPEILAGTGYGLKIDVWAAGVILYIMLCGFPPFFSPKNEQEILFERILSGKYQFSSRYWAGISYSVKELISNMLQIQPELRFSAEDVLDHPWLMGFVGGKQTTEPSCSNQEEQHWHQQCKSISLSGDQTTSKYSQVNIITDMGDGSTNAENSEDSEDTSNEDTTDSDSVSHTRDHLQCSENFSQLIQDTVDSPNEPLEEQDLIRLLENTKYSSNSTSKSTASSHGDCHAGVKYDDNYDSFINTIDTCTGSTQNLLCNDVNKSDTPKLSYSSRKRATLKKKSSEERVRVTLMKRFNSLTDGTQNSNPDCVLESMSDTSINNIVASDSFINIQVKQTDYGVHPEKEVSSKSEYENAYLISERFHERTNVNESTEAENTLDDRIKIDDMVPRTAKVELNQKCNSTEKLESDNQEHSRKPKRLSLCITPQLVPKNCETSTKSLDITPKISLRNSNRSGSKKEQVEERSNSSWTKNVTFNKKR